jgi:hypothetical protein
MSKLIWIELERPDEASQLAEMLEANGVQTPAGRSEERLWFTSISRSFGE